MLLRDRPLRLALLIALVALVNPALVRADELGDPLITNFEPDQYHAHTQNWVAVQDPRGVMYFGNSSGILEYDGARWRLIPIAGGTYARALAVAPDGTVFYGAVGDFGYLEAAPNGECRAVSLLPRIPKDERTFNDIWQALATPRGVYFFSREKLFRFWQGRVVSLPGRMASSQACLLRGFPIYVDRDHSVSLIDDDRVVPIPAFREVLVRKRIVLTPFAEHQLLAGRLEGDFLRLDLSAFWDAARGRYDFGRPASGHEVVPFPCELSRELPESSAFLYKLIPIDRDTFAMCSIKKGIALFDRQGRIRRTINTQNGLVDNTVADLFLDRDGSLWAPNNSGISHIELHPQHSRFGTNQGLRGVPMSVILHRERLYVGTYQNTFVKVEHPPSMDGSGSLFVPVRNAPNEVWQFMESGGDLLLASSQGLYAIRGEEAARIPGDTFSAYCLGISTRFPGHLFVGQMGGIEAFRQLAPGRWQSLGRLNGIHENVRSLTGDEHGNLWCATDGKWVLYLRFPTGKPSNPVVMRLGTATGLPDLTSMRPVTYRKRIYVASSMGLYSSPIPEETGPSTDLRVHFRIDDRFDRVPGEDTGPVLGILFGRRGEAYLNTREGVVLAEPQPDGRIRFDPRPFRGLPTTDESMSYDPRGLLWIPAKSLYRVDLNARHDTDRPFAVLIRQVVASGGRMVFAGTHARPGAMLPGRSAVFTSRVDDGQRFELPYRENAVTFEYAATCYEKGGGNQFQYLLQGFDHDWSPWTAKTAKEYTNLPEGRYVFRVRGRNVYGVPGQEAAFPLLIRPPWFRSWWALILWTLCGGGILLGAYHVTTQKLRRQKARLEKLVAERTRQLREATLTDPLTGLRNRRFITEVLSNDISAFIGFKNYLNGAQNHRASPPEDSVFGIFMLDIDFFKKVNDIHGHDAGDQVLKRLAKILTGLVRQDDAVIRVGGEEFLVVLKKAQPEYLPTFAQKVLDAISQARFEVGEGLALPKTCSVGYVSFPIYPQFPDLLTFDQTIMAADLALYRAKHDGRNRAVFLDAGPTLPETQESQQRTVTSLEFAVGRGHLQIGRTIRGPGEPC